MVSNPIKNETGGTYHDPEVKVGTKGFLSPLSFSGSGRFLEIYPNIMGAIYFNSRNPQQALSSGVDWEDKGAIIKDDKIFLFSNGNQTTYSKDEDGRWNGPINEIKRLLKLEEEIRSVYE